MKKVIYLLICVILIGTYVIIGECKNEVKEAKEVIVLEDKNINKYYDIKIGDSVDSVIKKIDNPDRKDYSEYGFEWYVYNRFKNNFVMVGIENDKVVGLYSNSINSTEMLDIKLGDEMDNIRKISKPIEYKKKGNTKFIIESNNQFDIFIEDGKYITVFYDIHNESKAISYQIIDKVVENRTQHIYPKYSEELKKSFEMQTIDLINSVRDKSGLKRLKLSEKASISSLKHSENMKNENFFDHINKKNETPFDRMKKEHISYSLAGENIAAGQINAIYAHEALMNSLGHRKNILGDYDNIGVGVSFGGHYNVYYTQNFYSE
ncbi:MAG: CAP-associated domain-containing protein [Paraclostridium sp.]|uniref:CAP domain-containing protein n=1 Tax=Paraclostridium sp. TaxID=2023273 RepID=UPI003F38F1C7